jgi:hypothetical protein
MPWQRTSASHKDLALCLYLPWNNEWGGHRYLSETVLPWASEWLVHYEAWLYTSEWQGRGVHLPRNQRSHLPKEGRKY